MNDIECMDYGCLAAPSRTTHVYRSYLPNQLEVRTRAPIISVTTYSAVDGPRGTTYSAMETSYSATDGPGHQLGEGGGGGGGVLMASQTDCVDSAQTLRIGYY